MTICATVRMTKSLLLEQSLLLLLLVAFNTEIVAQPLQIVESKECVYGDCENGRGTIEIETPTGKAISSGNFRNGEFHGYGRLEEPLSFVEKAVYLGNWENGIRNGRGTYWDGKKDLYIGQWRDNKRVHNYRNQVRPMRH